MLVSAIVFTQNLRKMGRAGWQQMTQQMKSHSLGDLLGDTRRRLRDRSSAKTDRYPRVEDEPQSLAGTGRADQDLTQGREILLRRPSLRGGEGRGGKLGFRCDTGQLLQSYNTVGLKAERGPESVGRSAGEFVVGLIGIARRVPPAQ